MNLLRRQPENLSRTIRMKKTKMAWTPNDRQRAKVVRVVRDVADEVAGDVVEDVKKPANPSVQKNGRLPPYDVRCVMKTIWTTTRMMTTNWPLKMSI